MYVYRTQVDIPRDRYVCLQLPDRLPLGRAIIKVEVLEPDPGVLLDFEAVSGSDLDRQDIEWWEEFDEGPGTAD